MASKRPVKARTTRRGKDAPETRRCNNCNKPFTPKRSTQKFCSDDCRRVKRNTDRSGTQQNFYCEGCGKYLEGKKVDARFCDSTCERRHYRKINGK